PASGLDRVTNIGIRGSPVAVITDSILTHADSAQSLRRPGSKPVLTLPGFSNGSVGGSARSRCRLPTDGAAASRSVLEPW
ncbi:MAG: hypothetical protein ABI647_21560, partial [Gemmatimonadota bacterium]